MIILMKMSSGFCERLPDKRHLFAHKDRLSRVGFSFIEKLFKRFGTEIVVVSEVGNKKSDAEEVFEEIVSLLHCFSMKLYSKRRDEKLEVSLVESSKD